MSKIFGPLNIQHYLCHEILYYKDQCSPSIFLLVCKNTVMQRPSLVTVNGECFAELFDFSKNVEISFYESWYDCGLSIPHYGFLIFLHSVGSSSLGLHQYANPFGLLLNIFLEHKRSFVPHFFSFAADIERLLPVCSRSQRA